MNIDDLVTHYVAFRRTLGERCNTTEKVLRSFSRAVGPRTPVTRIRSEVVADFLVGTGPVTRTWHFKYCTEGLLPVRGQPRAHAQGPLTDGTAQVPFLVRPVHLLARRTPPPV